MNFTTMYIFPPGERPVKFASAILILVATACSPQELGSRQALAAVAPTAEELVAARQAAFHMSGAAMGNMRATIEGGRDVAGQAYAARGVARWAKALPTLFPPETATIRPSRARPEIWANKDDFNAKAAAYAEAAAALATIAESGNRAAFETQFKATAATCKACHDLYQVPLPPAQ